MTSDAKIGLLLGLVFIFIIAFLINGLPSFNGRNNSELTTNVVGLQNNPPGLAAREREAINRTNSIEKQSTEVLTPPMGDPNIRFQTPLSQNPAVVKKENPATLKESDKVKPSKPSLPKFYVVVDGDNLAVIAKKFYGDEEGNRTVNVTRIFQANRKLLGSPDEIYIGQKLIVPPLPASALDKSKTEKVFSASIFEKVKSIGQRYLSSDGGKVKQGKQYVVREGDSLWKIAAEQLGEGSRYTEIAKLNGDILDDEDTLSIGMRLKMPARK